MWIHSTTYIFFIQQIIFNHEYNGASVMQIEYNHVLGLYRSIITRKKTIPMFFNKILLLHNDQCGNVNVFTNGFNCYVLKF